jgi:hypothetical protein
MGAIDAYPFSITDAISLSLIQGVTGPSSSTSGPVMTGAGTTPQPPVGHGTSSSEPMVIDSPREDVESPVPLPSLPPCHLVLQNHPPLYRIYRRSDRVRATRVPTIMYSHRLQPYTPSLDPKRRKLGA